MRCGGAQRLIDALFVSGAPSTARSRTLWHHLGGCASCRRRYDRLMLLDRLVGDPGAGLLQPSSREIDVVARVVEARRVASVAPWRASMAALLRSAQPLAWAAALLLVVVSAVIWQQRREAERWAVRAALSESLAIRTFCVGEDVRGEPIIRSYSNDPSPQEVGTCADNGRLRFAYLSDVPGYLVVLQLRGGELEWLMPNAADGQPHRIDSTSKLSALPLELGPEALRGRGAIELVFLRSPTPAGPAEIERVAGRSGAAAAEPWGDSGVFMRYRINLERTEP